MGGGRGRGVVDFFRERSRPPVSQTILGEYLRRISYFHRYVRAAVAGPLFFTRIFRVRGLPPSPVLWGISMGEFLRRDSILPIAHYSFHRYVWVVVIGGAFLRKFSRTFLFLFFVFLDATNCREGERGCFRSGIPFRHPIHTLGSANMRDCIVHYFSLAIPHTRTPKGLGLKTLQTCHTHTTRRY